MLRSTRSKTPLNGLNVARNWSSGSNRVAGLLAITSANVSKQGRHPWRCDHQFHSFRVAASYMRCRARVKRWYRNHILDHEIYPIVISEPESYQPMADTEAAFVGRTRIDWERRAAIMRTPFNSISTGVPMPIAGPSGKHVEAERLFNVAISPDQQLLPNEFDHLKRCLWCLERFVHFVRQILLDKQKSA